MIGSLSNLIRFTDKNFIIPLIVKVTSCVIPLQGLADNKKHLVQFLKYDDHEQKYA